MTKPVKIAVLADIHYGPDAAPQTRRCDIADILTKRAVYRLNKLIKPDVTLVLGDVVNDGSVPDAEKHLAHIRSILDTLDSPYIAIPGNHDDDAEQFYRAFDRPEDFVDIAGVRFLPFMDKAEPRYWASRTAQDMERMRAARSGYSGPLVSLQHVCLCPPVDQPATPYNYTNAAEVIGVMKEAGVNLSISGHHHRGGKDTSNECTTFVNAPGLCESPFPFLEVIIDDNEITTKRHELVMPEHLGLKDNHIHTQLAYCSQNMDVEKAKALAKDFGLAGVTFTEHTGQLYFDRQSYWKNVWLHSGMHAADAKDNRMTAYLELKRIHEDEFARFSVEADCDVNGAFVIGQNDRKNFDSVMGVIHALPGLTKETPPQERNCNDFLFLVEAMCKHGIRILAHPMRIFRRSGWPTPPELLRPTAELLKKHGVAAEINFHTNEPPLEFIRLCLELEVKFSLGSDAHHLAEVGDFAYHLALLKDAGFDGDLADILLLNK